ncbi:hypothetical protein J0680_24945, partial [Vibrio parahaemolyticus]|uniref:hypothetical protein n=1 Tax=Vibrio parahaemolyticus TaxID=670 RepID=UPI001A8EB5F3
YFVDCSENWFGTSQPTIVQSLVKDFYNESSVQVAIYSPYLATNSFDAGLFVDPNAGILNRNTVWSNETILDSTFQNM